MGSNEVKEASLEKEKEEEINVEDIPEITP